LRQAGVRCDCPNDASSDCNPALGMIQEIECESFFSFGETL